MGQRVGGMPPIVEGDWTDIVEGELSGLPYRIAISTNLELLR